MTPISREEFERGRVDLGVPIFSLLITRRNIAYNSEEIRHLLADETGRTSEVREVQEALAELVERGRVRTVQIEDVGWYIVDEGYLRSIERGQA